MTAIRIGGALRRAPFRTATLLAIGAALLAAASCGEREPTDGVRRVALREIAAAVVLPSYRDLEARAGELAAAAAALAAAPDAARLDATRAAWRAARAAWQRSEAFSFGPSETLRIPANIAWLAIRPDRIELEIAAGSDFSSADIDDLGADRRGFLAIEYLLFEPDGAAATLQSLSAAAPRRSYLAALAENLYEQTVLLHAAWDPQGGNFLRTWAEAGRVDGPFETLADAVDELVNRMIFLAEDVADRQLLGPLGRGDEPPHPELEATIRSFSGIADARNDVIGIRNVYRGSLLYASTTSLAALVGGISPETDRAIRGAIDETLRTLDAIPPPLSYAVVAAPETVETAQRRAVELRRYLEIDLVSVLGTTLRFNPSDGD